MKNIYLHGGLGKRFGRKWSINAQTPYEAASALFANSPELEKYIFKKEQEGIFYGIKKGNSKDFANKEEYQLKTNQDLHLFPIPVGSDLTGFAVSLLVTAITTAASMYISKKIAEAMQRDDKTLQAQTKSFLYNGSDNRFQQGSSVPLGYGMMKVGSNVISACTINYDFDAHTNKVFAFDDGLFSLVPEYSKFYDPRVGPLGSCFFFNLFDGDNTYKVHDPAYQYIQSINQSLQQGSNDGAYGTVSQTAQQLEKKILGGVLGALSYKFNYGKGIDTSKLQNFQEGGNWYPGYNAAGANEPISNGVYPLLVSNENALRTAFVCIQSVPIEESKSNSDRKFYPISLTKESIANDHKYVGGNNAYAPSIEGIDVNGVIPIPVGERWKGGNKSNGVGWFKLESVGVYKAIDLVSEGPIDGFASSDGELKVFDRDAEVTSPPNNGGVPTSMRYPKDDYLQGVYLNDLPIKEINPSTNQDSYNINEFDIDAGVNNEGVFGTEDQKLLENQYLFTAFTKQINAQLFGPRLINQESLISSTQPEAFIENNTYGANTYFSQGESLYRLKESLNETVDGTEDYSQVLYNNGSWSNLEVVSEGENGSANHFVPKSEAFEEYKELPGNIVDYNKGEKVKSIDYEGNYVYFEMGEDAKRFKGNFKTDGNYVKGDILTREGSRVIYTATGSYQQGDSLSDFTFAIPYSIIEELPEDNRNYSNDFYNYFKEIRDLPGIKGSNYTIPGENEADNVTVSLPMNMVEQKKDITPAENSEFWYKIVFDRSVNNLSASITTSQGGIIEIPLFQAVDSVTGNEYFKPEEENYISHTVINPLVEQLYVSLQVDELMYVYQGDEIEITYKVGSIFGAIMGGIAALGAAGALQAFDVVSTTAFVAATAAAIGAVIGAIIGNNSEFTMGTKIENSGELWPNRAKFRIKYGNQGETMYFTDVIVYGLATTAYRKDIRIYLPNNPNQRDRVVKVYKLNRERNAVIEGEQAARYKERMSLAAITEITPVKMNYPNSVVIGTRVNAKDSSSIPKRSYNLRLKKVQVPRNYNSETRKYEGFWDGTFKDELEWTDNPAWCLYDLISNKRFGVGKYGLKEENIDRWTLYKMAKYCDEIVPSGYSSKYKKRTGKTNGSKLTFSDTGDDFNFNLEFNHPGKYLAIFHEDGSYESIRILSVQNQELTLAYTPISSSFECAVSIEYPLLEPRYTMNCFIMNKQNALKLINEFASIFRAFTYWSDGAINFFQDEKKEAVMFFSNSNIDESGFRYSSTPKTSRTNTCNVRYMDKYNFYRAKIERAEDRKAITDNTMIEQTIEGFGITSQAQAKRAAEFLIKTANMETELLVFKTSMPGSYLKPGDVIDVLDNKKTVGRFAGKIVDIQLDDRGLYGEIEVDYPIFTFVDNQDQATWKTIEIYAPEGNETVRSLDGSGEVSDIQIDKLRAKQFDEFTVFDLSENGRRMKIYNNLYEYIPASASKKGDGFTWSDALRDAKQRGGKLAEIPNEVSQAIINSTIPRDNTKVAWLGGYNKESPLPEELLWAGDSSCDSEIKYFNWDKDFPKLSQVLETDIDNKKMRKDEPKNQDIFLAAEHPEFTPQNGFLTIHGSEERTKHGKWRHDFSSAKYGYIFEKVYDDKFERIRDSAGTTFVLNDGVNLANPKQYKVINITEESNGLYAIQAIQYNIDKFDNIEKNISLSVLNSPVVFTDNSIYGNK